MFGNRKTQSSSTISGSPSTPSDKEMTDPKAQAQLTDGKPTRQPIGFETIIGANCTLKGEVTSTANVRIDGTIDGTVNVEGNVMIGETARITADLVARNISIAGAVRGNVTGQKIQLLRTGRVWGDIHATALTTEEGAFIDGKIAMMGHPAETEKQVTGSLNPPAETGIATPLVSSANPTAMDDNEAVEGEIIEDDATRTAD